MPSTMPPAHSTRVCRGRAPGTLYRLPCLRAVRLCLRAVRGSLLAISNNSTYLRCGFGGNLLRLSFLPFLTLYRRDRLLLLLEEPYPPMKSQIIGQLAKDGWNNQVLFWT